MPVTIGSLHQSRRDARRVADAACAASTAATNTTGLGDRYARFLMEEILPEVGKQYKLSSDPNDRAIAGSSSGGDRRLHAAWERPDAFRRVLSFVGSYTNLRGGDIYPPDPQDRAQAAARLPAGRHERPEHLRRVTGTWPTRDGSSLEYAGYDVKFVVGTEGTTPATAPRSCPTRCAGSGGSIPSPSRMSTRNRRGITYARSSTRRTIGRWSRSGYQYAEGPSVDRRAILLLRLGGVEDLQGRRRREARRGQGEHRRSAQRHGRTGRQPVRRG